MGAPSAVLLAVDGEARCLFLSGWYFLASCRYLLRMSRIVALRDNPSIWYRSLDISVVSYTASTPPNVPTTTTRTRRTTSREGGISFHITMNTFEDDTTVVGWLSSRTNRMATHIDAVDHCIIRCHNRSTTSAFVGRPCSMTAAGVCERRALSLLACFSFRCLMGFAAFCVFEL